MKIGRNDLCPCSSGKKYKRCCMNSIARQHAAVFDDIAQVVASSPGLNMDALDQVVQHKVTKQNMQGLDDFCGLTPDQISNWLYAPFDELADVVIRCPDDLSASPVMRYLALILDEAMQQDGAFKLTAKGNLPAKLVAKASALLPEFAVAEFNADISISEFAGSNEDKFNALHYARILAELAGIIYHKAGRFHVKKSAQAQYKKDGLNAFYVPMLKAATGQYNWGYFDGFADDVNLRLFWVFMLWRLQKHGSVDQLVAEVCVAFPALVEEVSASELSSKQDNLGFLIESRFVMRFLEFWGFVTVNPKRFENNEPLPINANIQPLLSQTFKFAF
ncbi:YecA family protein [Algibacillus agarilyticus]|uniref:YecA family protein n=1 Tax=Algibacillus agarilyticus TaxID=2234133 RepID=UPI000DD03429|nr:SEC-C domain-containing protein [Algibacillus agarilyticus]